MVDEGEEGLSGEGEPEQEEQADDDSWLAKYRDLDLDSSADDLDLDFIPEGIARDRARKVFGTMHSRMAEERRAAQELSDQAELAKATYESETEHLRKVAEKLESGTGLEELEEYQQVYDANKGFADQMTKITWQAFNAYYPDWENAPEAQRQAFSEIILGNEEKGISPTLFSMKGETYLDKMVDAWNLAAFRTDTPKPTRYRGPGGTAAPPVAQPESEEDKAAARAAAVIGSGGRRATAGKDLDSKTVEEILDEHEHLL